MELRDGLPGALCTPVRRLFWRAKSRMIERARHWRWSSPGYLTQWRDIYVAAVDAAADVSSCTEVVSMGEWFDFREPEASLIEGGWNFERPWRKKGPLRGWLWETVGHWRAWIVVPAGRFGEAIEPAWSTATYPMSLVTGTGPPDGVGSYAGAERGVDASCVRVEMTADAHDELSVFCRPSSTMPDPAATLDAITDEIENTARTLGVATSKRWDSGN